MTRVIRKYIQLMRENQANKFEKLQMYFSLEAKLIQSLDTLLIIYM